MWTKKIISVAATILIVSFFISCEKRKHSSFRIFISNQSTHDVIAEHPIFPKTDTIVLPYDKSSGNHIVTLWSVEYLDEVLPKLSDKEFAEKVSTLKVYYMSNENEPIYIGGSENYCRLLSNWEYRFSEDDGYGIHEYILLVEDE